MVHLKIHQQVHHRGIDRLQTTLFCPLEKDTPPTAPQKAQFSLTQQIYKPPHMWYGGLGGGIGANV